MSTTKLFASIPALRSSIQKDIETYELPIEKNDVNKAFFEPNNDTFEAVCIQEGNPQKILIPAANMYPFLFRGQTKDFGKGLPSLYREEDKQTAPYLFLERLREVEFTELIKKHPVVKGFFDRHHFTVDFIGLAQHYGLKTDVLDLTNDLDVALFFAMCPYDSLNDQYTYHDDGKQHTAILYVVPPTIYAPSLPDSFLKSKITAIGLQPFKRPGAQRGFALHLPDGEQLRAYKYEFQFTCEDSKKYFDQFKQGEALWIKDELIAKAKVISQMKTFSYDTFKKAFAQYPPKGYSKTSIKKELKAIGVEILTKGESTHFTEEEITSIKNDWNITNKQQMQEQITRINWFADDDCTIDPITKQKTVNLDKRHLYRNLKMLGELEMIRLVQASQFCTGGEYVDYNPKKKEEKKTHRETDWERMGGYSADAKGKSYLEDTDMMLK